MSPPCTWRSRLFGVCSRFDKSDGHQVGSSDDEAHTKPIYNATLRFAPSFARIWFVAVCLNFPSLDSLLAVPPPRFMAQERRQGLLLSLFFVIQYCGV